MLSNTSFSVAISSSTTLVISATSSGSLSVIFVLSLIGVYLVYHTGNYGGKLAEQVIINSTSSIQDEK